MDKKNRQQLNAEQRAAAFCTENAVVAAGAGSGKTMVLANRFAWLLTEKGYKVDEILTLTFTTKAAAQMYKRIHSLISEIAENETGRKAERAREALDDFIHARIQTLDSYSTAIVKQCAPRYGISPDFIIDQERCHELAVEESLPFLIAHRHHPAIEKLYADNRPSDIAHSLFADVLLNYCRIDKPRDFTEDVKTQFDIICDEWKNQRSELTSVLKETENLIFGNHALLPDLVPLMDKYRKGNISIPKSDGIRKYFDSLLNLPPEDSFAKAESHSLQKTMIKILRFLADINDMNLQRGKRSGNPIKGKVKQIRALFGKFSSLAVYCMQAGFIISVMHLLVELQTRYLNRKRAEGVLTFRDVASLSRTILLEQRDIRQNEKESFKAIMIDEFQDNNELQKELLFLLAEKIEVMNEGIPPAEDLCCGKLFFVGDEKQSIYLFRGADVSVFRKLKDEIKSAALPLKINYRSAPHLIGAFNALFGGVNFDTGKRNDASEEAAPKPSIFAPSGSALPLYEASYTPLEAGSKVSGADGSPGKLSLCVLDKSDDGEDDEQDERTSADENEARFVAEKIWQLLYEKKYRPRDIAILFRARSPQHLFEKHLRMLNVPYTCEDINDFFYGGLVNDTMSVLRLAAHPLDSAAYAEMLRSPFAGLSMSGTALCLSIFTQAKNPQPFNDEPLLYLEIADQKNYRCGQKIYASIRGKAAGESISSLVSELWYKEGYRYETEWNPQTSVYRELYDYLFHLAVKADAANQGLAAFTDSMRAFRGSGKRLSDIEIPLERPGGVHLLTIHKSKGLEFPVVFLCGSGKHSQSSKSDDVFFSNETGIVFSPPLPLPCYSIYGMCNNFFWEQSSAEAKQKRTAELRRLLYVGMTRAEKELYITGSLGIKDDAGTEDFPVKLKKYIEKKCRESENLISGDFIWDNDTFFGLLLPSIVSHITPDGFDEGSSFFTLDAIPPYTEDYVKSDYVKTSFTNDQIGLNEFLREVEPFYLNAEVIKTPILRDNHVTPVSLKNMDKDGGSDNLPGRGFFINREFSGEKSYDVFEKIDSMVAHYSQIDDEYDEKFNYGSFGTIAHICVEARLNAKEPRIPSNIAGFLNPTEADVFLEAGKELACRFVRSPLGRIARNSKLRESEFSFRSLIKNKSGKSFFINGTIDLLFEDTNSIHVIDFKTDNREIPVEHITQMACYHRAVSDLFASPSKKDCRIWLYYLRTGHAVEMTQRVKQFKLEERMFA